MRYHLVVQFRLPELVQARRTDDQVLDQQKEQRHLLVALDMFQGTVLPTRGVKPRQQHPLQLFELFVHTFMIVTWLLLLLGGQ